MSGRYRVHQSQPLDISTQPAGTVTLKAVEEQYLAWLNQKQIYNIDLEIYNMTKKTDERYEKLMKQYDAMIEDGQKYERLMEKLPYASDQDKERWRKIWDVKWKSSIRSKQVPVKQAALPKALPAATQYITGFSTSQQGTGPCACPGCSNAQHHRNIVPREPTVRSYGTDNYRQPKTSIDF